MEADSSSAIARTRAPFVAEVNLVWFQELGFSCLPGLGRGCAEGCPAWSFLCSCLFPLADSVPVTVAVFLPGNTQLSRPLARITVGT